MKNKARPEWARPDKGEIMAFTRERNNQLVLAWPLALAVIAAAVTACGGGSASSLAQGAAPGKWTKAEVSQFTAVGGTGGNDSQDLCVIGYFERDMSFVNAMAVASVDPASGGMSTAQIESAVVGKYGTTEGSAINAQFEQVVSDAAGNCDTAMAKFNTASGEN